MRTTILLIATIVLQLAAASVRCERSDYRCGPRFNGDTCDGERCCSTSGYCGQGYNYCSIRTCASQCHASTAAVNGATDLMSTGAPTVSCSAYRVNMSMAWIQEYGPTVFCGNQTTAAAESDVPTNMADACGRCLKVTKHETGIQKIARLLEDECDTKGPLLGNTIFHELDTDDGKGAAQGYLTVNFQVVPCED